MQNHLSYRALMLASACLAWTSAASAQDAALPSPPSSTIEDPPAADVPRDAEGLQDIIVTASKSLSSVQRTALAMTAVDGEALRDRQINSIESLATSLPNVNFGKNVGVARIAIRGVGFDSTVIGQEGRVAYHTDGVYISRQTAVLATFFDVQRVEVVRGPQGTLYGRNATAGAINVITNDPSSQLGGYANFTVGNYGLISSDGAITGGSDLVSARLAYQIVDRGGYGRNFTLREDIDDEKSYAFRGKIKFEPSQAFDFVLSADYSRQKDHAFVYHYLGAGSPGVIPLGQALGGTVPANPRDSQSDVSQYNFRRFYGFAATANLNLGFGTLTSITGYRRSFTDWRTDADGTSALTATFRILERSKQFSQELRLSGSFDRFDYLVGAYYFSEDIFGFNSIAPLRSPAPPFGFRQGIDFRGDSFTRATAVFAQLSYDLLTNFTVTVGGRYSRERKGIDHRGMQDLVTPYDPALPFVYTLNQVASETERAFTPRVGIEYRAMPDVLFYATFAQGFKSGGYNNNAFGAPLRPEKLTDFEGGLKAEFFNRRLRTNFAAFYYDYTDLQLQRSIGAAAIPVNAGKAIVKGIEAEVVARPISGLELSGNVSLLDSEIKDFQTFDAARPSLGLIDIEGKRLPQSPTYTINLAASYTIPTNLGDFTLRGEAFWTDRIFFSFYNLPETSQAAFDRYNAFINYKSPSSQFTVSLFIRNIANRRTISSRQVSGGFNRFPILGTFDPPRTFGATIGYSF